MAGLDGQAAAPPMRERVVATVSLVAAVVVVVAGRWPFLDRVASPDEAGFLVIGGQWSSGSSLYGDFWVDRPPLLVTYFWLAAHAGGLTALRVLGIVASVVVVLAVGWAAARVAGPRAVAWAAPVAAVLCISDALGAQTVNGEVLAAPLVALGFGAGICAVGSTGVRTRLAWAAATGFLGVAAVGVKQNMVDVAVFALILLVVCLLTRRCTPRQGAQLVGGALGGAVAALGLTALWTVSRGTSLTEVWYAMYRFRLDARDRIDPDYVAAAVGRREVLLDIWVEAGLAALMLCVVAGAIWLRTREPVLVALTAVLAYDAFSVVMGGAYWSHYLVQLVVPLSLGFGIVAARLTSWRRLLPAVVAAWVVVAALASAADTPRHPPEAVRAERAGAAIAGAAEPGDTVVVVLAGSQIVHATGLASPYPYLWGLPIRTLDPGLDELREVFEGDDPPTWVVLTTRPETRGASGAAVRAVLDEEYERVATIGGHPVLVRRDVERPTPLPRARQGSGGRFSGGQDPSNCLVVEPVRRCA
jgi:hypothetical protein